MPRGRDTVLTRIAALRRHAHQLEGAVAPEPVRVEDRQVIDTLGETNAWLRGLPSPEGEAHIARMASAAGRRLFALGGDVP